jgi:hypothetical protein
VRSDVRVSGEEKERKLKFEKNRGDNLLLLDLFPCSDGAGVVRRPLSALG